MTSQHMRIVTQSQNPRRGAATVGLLEIAIALLLVVALGLVGIPAWQSRRILDAERSVVRTLVKLHGVQASELARKPERGWLELREILSLPDPTPGAPKPFDLGLRESGEFATDGAYYYVLYLISQDGIGVLRRPTDEARLPCLHAIVYAWPRKFGATGQQIYALSESGALLSTDNALDPKEGSSEVPPFHLIGGYLGPEHPLTKASLRSEGHRWSPVDAVTPR